MEFTAVRAPSRPVIVPAPEPRENAGLLADLLASEAASASAGPVSGSRPLGPPCVGCGERLTPGAVICTNCGFNSASGKSVRTKVRKADDGKALKAAATVGAAAASPVISLIGATIGAAIGGAAWVAVAYFFHYELAYIAWLLGAATGMGATVAVGTSGGAGWLAGAIAASVAAVAIFACRFATGSLLLEQLGFSDVPLREWLPQMFTGKALLFTLLGICTAAVVGGTGSLGGD